MPTEQTGRECLINANFGLVHACANKFRGRGVDYDDLFQAGCVGLVKAADNFDSSRGFAFSTYAVPVILGEIRRIFRDGGAVKIGRSLKERARHAMKLRDELSAELGREPTVSELAEKLGTDIPTATELITVSMPTVSLTVSEDGKNAGQFDIPTLPPEEEISERLSLKCVLDSLDEKDRKLIELRYFKGLTQVKTAKELGMSQVQVSRKEKAILIKMRNSLQQ
ncbi:MAG: sigma-70 family RNA polymerase sigma factor [Clostridia bacterium]|nr:sigma-70 family RNA polymerase sigma factor [Oscillospiraceae bacterium]MBQ7004975.1 sigma-70 family RNA polymerase sigma factor [Clostridia bacterium]